jgi:hypothetical protein
MTRVGKIDSLSCRSEQGGWDFRHCNSQHLTNVNAITEPVETSSVDACAATKTCPMSSDQLLNAYGNDFLACWYLQGLRNKRHRLWSYIMIVSGA